MSKLTKICFDASYHEGCVGIGIFNFDTQEEIIQRYKVESVNSSLAETMALVQTLKYMKERKISSAHLFTDNMMVAKKGISKKLKGRFSDLTLTWIPREFNIDADRLSKRAHLLNAKEIAVRVSPNKKAKKKSEMDPDIITEKINSRATKAKIPKLNSIKASIREYPLNQRIRVLRKLVNTRFSDKLLKSLTGTSVDLDHSSYRKEDRMFLKMYFSIIKDNECQQKNLMKDLRNNYIKKLHTNQSLESSLCDLKE